ncbi:hypothetical protein GKC41_03410 [Bifidobacterium asteroides]|uniref:Uncharacterized protein n=1 Tax=Bifidobacterium asteroides TaxID=1684 RepID=A0A6N7TTC3_9BIFI|nr:hypothetical protein [Bifidobacterium asteroides]MSD90709.1 hypothetical protein [Bifidobacterium asteroides]
MSDLHIGDGLHKVLLAGIGALATGVEKGQEVIDNLVKKGELTVEQGKILNTELKRNRQNPPAPAPASAPADSAPAPAAGAPRPATHVAPDPRRPDHEPLAPMPNRRSGSIPITSNDPIAGQQG